MHNFRTNYAKILEVLREIDDKDSFVHQIRQPKLSDKGLISINLTSECFGIDSECQLFRILPPFLSSKIERSVYNRRKRKLFAFQEQLRLKLARYFNRYEDFFIVDSMPLEVCKLPRANRSKICKQHIETAPDKGFCASQNMRYYGYKLHAVYSVKGVFESIDISKASIHDIHYLKDIKDQLKDCILLAHNLGNLDAQKMIDTSCK